MNGYDHTKKTGFYFVESFLGYDTISKSAILSVVQAGPHNRQLLSTMFFYAEKRHLNFSNQQYRYPANHTHHGTIFAL